METEKMDMMNEFGVPDSVPRVPEMSEKDRLRAIELLNGPGGYADPNATLVIEFLHREVIKLWHMVHNQSALLADQKRRTAEYTFNI